ncbi:hypothetical protein PVK06_029757 [Gossypium arboreum]|uniref:Uncharacterized protein n=1 Tax=Gossypium arboreum TaxID=29729 RepID=A0ABR0NLX9_GOSAR|nr:hypothetical protein PVK06_029757 [Gossypium arboreum]
MPKWMNVNQLIEAETNTWDKELIHKIVDEDTARHILSITISGTNTGDMLVWKYEGSGEYTVKSGYRVLSTELLQTYSSTSPNTDCYRDFYKSLWSLNIPVKIKIHNGSLLTIFASFL